jgi:tetratricopeptide (TPR) repeat protein/transcriptional regulator with XRE-family HTH domain
VFACDKRILAVTVAFRRRKVTCFTAATGHVVGVPETLLRRHGEGKLILGGGTLRSINSFAAAVHRLLRARGMTLEDVAAQARYSPSYLSKMMHGRRRLLPAVVSKIDKVLDADGELERIAQDQDADGVTPARPMQQPPAAAEFVGREEYLHQLDEALVAQDRPGAAVIAVIEGGFWVGKTELALQWAARVERRFDGGCLYADLHGLAPGVPADPGDVLDMFLRALGAGSEALRGTLADRVARYRSLLAQRPALVVLDNVAGYDQVRHLLPGAGSAVVITSREHQPTLLLRSGGLHLELPPLTPDEALTLLRRRLGDARVDADPAAAEAVVRRCGRLPTAVLIAAEHIRQRHHGSLGDLAEGLATEQGRLDLFSSPDPAVNIHGVLDVSYLALPPQARRVFRLLGISPAHLASAESTAALTGLGVAAARDALDLLRHAHLLEDAHAGRMRMNHLLRAYAYQRAIVEEPLSEVERAHDRVLRWYTASAWYAGNALAPQWSGRALVPDDVVDIEPLGFSESGYDGAVAWCEDEVETAIYVARHARSRAARDAVWMLPTLFLPYFYLTKNWGMWLTAASESLAAARRFDSQRGIGWCLHSLGWAQHELGRTDEAVANLREALRLRTEPDEDDRVRGWSSFSLGAAYLTLGLHQEARDYFAAADAFFAEQDFDFGLAFTRAVLAHVHQASGDTAAATDAAVAALGHAQKVPSAPVLSLAHHQYGLLLLQQQQHRTALTHLDAALTLRRTSRERWGEAETLIARAETLSALGEPERARESYREAATILETLHDPRALEIRTQIATLDACLRSRDDRAS